MATSSPRIRASFPAPGVARAPSHVEPAAELSSNSVIMKKLPAPMSDFSSLQYPPQSHHHLSYLGDQNLQVSPQLTPGGILSSSQLGQQGYRFPQPFTVHINGSPLYAASSPVFPLRNKTNLPTSSPNLLLQTILRDSQQVKAEYEHYKNEARLKQQQQEATIRELKENLDSYQKKLLEMKLQKEVFVARESYAFQEIYEVVHSLLGKVSAFAQAESLNLEMMSPPQQGVWHNSNFSKSEESNLISGFDDLAEKLRCLERKMVAFERTSQGVLLTCKATEANLKMYMAATNEKLDQIMFSVMENKGFTPPQAAVREDTVSMYNASVEDNQEDSDACDVSAAAATGEIISPSSNKLNMQQFKAAVQSKNNPEKKPSLSSCKKEIQSAIRRKRKSWNKANNKSVRKKLCHIKRRRCETVRYDDVRKQKQGVNGLDEDLEQPPVLSPPSRAAKYSKLRSESMPILHPEDGYCFQPKIEQVAIPTNIMSLQQQENRKDDALIGIKRENFANRIHRKDFSKTGFVCLCGAKFTGAGGLYVHQVKTMENEKFSCKSCGKKFHYFSGLKAHRKSAHKQDFTQEVGCSRCGQIFKSKKDRQGHLDERGQTCWLSGSYQSKDWEAIRHKRKLSSSSSYYSSSTSPSSTPSSQNVNSQS